MSRRGLIWLCGAVAAFALFVHSCVRFMPAAPDRPTRAADADGTMAVPVANVRREQLIDTFTQSRGEGRPHDAIDIPAPRGTPVLAAASGTVEKLFFSERGGKTIYVRSPDRRWLHYYAHLDQYRPGLAEQQTVRRGDVLGTVGSSGNADPAGPHLHFAVHQMTPREKWYEGQPVNPYPLLTASRH